MVIWRTTELVEEKKEDKVQGAEAHIELCSERLFELIKYCMQYSKCSVEFPRK
jgi:hypothetical protein